MKDYYKILELQKDATSQEVKKAYFGFVRKFPPERFPQEFMKIREAYEVLIDDNARKQYDATDAMPEIVKHYYVEAGAALEQGDSQRAVDLLEDVTKIYSNYAILNCMLGDAYYENDNSGKAIKVFEKLVVSEPGNAGFNGKLAHSYLNRGWHRKAADSFHKAVLLDEDNISFWMGLIDCYVKMNNFVIARQITNEAIEISKVRGWDGLELYYHHILLDLFSENHSALNEHLKDMKDLALKDETENENVAWFLASLGEIMLQHDEHEISMAVLNTAFELAPNNKEIRDMKEKADQKRQLVGQLEKLKKDKAYLDIMAELIEAEMDKCNDPDCYHCALRQLLLEVNILSQNDTCKRQMIRLRSAYPDLYQIKKKFFDEVINERNLESMYYRLSKKYNKMLEENEDEDEDDDEDDFSFLDSMGNTRSMFEAMGNNNLYLDSLVEQQPLKRDENKVGRNDPCPCGSGKKYKKCCGS